MHETINGPDHWRKRAKEARSAANSLQDEKQKRRLLQVADEYEQLAERIQKFELRTSRHL